jgi:Ca-activated chloride channel family protein
MNEDLSDLDLIELLERLSPVPEPAVVSLWPQTEAWLWVVLIGLALAAALTRRLWLRRRANAYRRAALEEIRLAGESPAALAEILRRTALAAFPRSDVAGLFGEEWLAFLDRTSGSDRAFGRSAFREGPGRAFALAPYQSEMQETNDTKELARLAARWVRRHQPRQEGEP